MSRSLGTTKPLTTNSSGFSRALIWKCGSPSTASAVSRYHSRIAASAARSTTPRTPCLMS